MSKPKRAAPRLDSTTEKVAAEMAAARAAGTLKSMMIDLPAERHMRFKLACVVSGRHMAYELVAFMERRTAELMRESA